MQRFHGTAARQMVLLDEAQAPRQESIRPKPAGARIRLMQKDLYVELTRRRRRAQIAARRLLHD